jgi:alginate O-acetyltransferase complex protein AlgI
MLNLNSIDFFLFFGLVYLLYITCKDYGKQNLVLLIASGLFYASFHIYFLLILFASSILDYFLSHFMGKENPRRKWAFIAGITLNLLLLGVFKYYNFFIQNWSELLCLLGFNPNLPVLKIILPVGISFYTFQKIAYLSDVYTAKIEPVREFTVYLLFVSFFPKILAGPIESSRHFLPQLQKKRPIGRDDLRIGFLWLITGCFLKMVVSDSLAPLVDRAFGHPGEVTGITFLLAILAFSLQIYADFAGYTLLARGLSRLMGFHLMENFNTPYFSRHPREFWRRWHISLSLWLREYLYIPLGGNRQGELRTYINLMITMLLAGLWHGASWNFVVWGGYHGGLLWMTHRLGLRFGDRRSVDLGSLMAMITTFLLISLGWFIFRLYDLSQLPFILNHIIHNMHGNGETLLALRTVLPCLILLFFYDYSKWRFPDDPALLSASNHFMKTVVYGFMILCILAAGFKPLPFIYFQF